MESPKPAIRPRYVCGVLEGDGVGVATDVDETAGAEYVGAYVSVLAGIDAQAARKKRLIAARNFIRE